MTKEEKRRWYAEQEERERQGLPTEVINESDYNPFWNPFSDESEENLKALGEGLSDFWDRFRNGETNTTGKEIADENLAYERERSEVEDARYDEETAYNRAWAEDERNYNRALQERLFAREDTAASRQAADLANVGINPLSYQLNGANAGQAVTSATAPVSSSRSANPLHNDFKMQEFSPLQALSALSGIAQAVNGVATGQYQRDALALQNDAKFLENYKLAHDLGLDYGQLSTSKKKRNTSTSKSVYDSDSNSNYTFIYPSLGNNPDFIDSRGNYFREAADKKRQLEGKKSAGIFDWESDKTKFIKSLGSLDFQNIAERFLTNVGNAGNWINSNFKDFNKDMENSAIMNFIRKFFAL